MHLFILFLIEALVLFMYVIEVYVDELIGVSNFYVKNILEFLYIW